MQVGHTICFIGIVKMIRAYCVCRVHSGSMKLMGADCVGRAHPMLIR